MSAPSISYYLFLVNMLYEFRQRNYNVTYYCMYTNILIKYNYLFTCKGVLCYMQHNAVNRHSPFLHKTVCVKCYLDGTFAQRLLHMSDDLITLY